ncbi:MAG: DEAD/DEAH box helicase [Alphaproteobacteria bacterium]|jgi:superfamily II DNA/RNA helicase|nr:DEAD/DEAH box helicase [Alphaproteobacteria bacterium]
MTFDELGLGPNVLKAIHEAGYETPTPIQEQAIPHVILGGDVTGIAQTGTGKTAAFVLPMIHRLAQGRARARMPRCLILAPTRELAAQVAESFETYGKHLKLSMALLIGGVSFKEQDKLLMQGVDVLIATPGRLMDQFDRGKLLLTGVETLIIDEADRMLDMGFIPDIERICKLLPPKRQTLLFSATMPPEITRLAETFQKDPKRIEVSRPTQTAETITQHVTKIETGGDKARRVALRAILRTCDIKNGIVFCNRKREVDVVVKSLAKHGFDAAAIHGDLPQAYRTQTLEKFREGELTLLVASDVAARGLDIPDVSHVFNYAPPPKDEDYIHRIGRTGRAGRTGESYTIVGPDDEKAWAGVRRMIKTDVRDFMPEGLEDELKGLGEDAGSSRKGRGSRRSGPDDSKRSRGQPRDKARSGAPEKESGSERRSRGGRRRDSKRNNGSELEPAADGVTGFGEHVPDFLKR